MKIPTASLLNEINDSLNEELNLKYTKLKLRVASVIYIIATSSKKKFDLICIIWITISFNRASHKTLPR